MSATPNPLFRDILYIFLFKLKGLCLKFSFKNIGFLKIVYILISKDLISFELKFYPLLIIFKFKYILNIKLIVGCLEHFLLGFLRKVDLIAYFVPVSLFKL
ncbi:hypothetical protein H312_01890 [Anncaliia algerae PRA339]|uniref:Uncharacterized protein n=1 Tax=Anncaliia algerae PRA339 TaxID=1288291 RepID=A0A059F0P6_9MICR|nr:hypothetical protein H312_01890 [Anncaliia algerae PRA339]